MGVLLGEIQIQSQSADDIVVPFLDPAEDLREIPAGRGQIIAFVEHVGHLGVPGKTLSGSGGNDKKPRWIFADDIAYFFEMLGIGKGTAAEFNDLDM